MHVKGYGSLFAKKYVLNIKKLKENKRKSHKRKSKNHEQNL